MIFEIWSNNLFVLYIYANFTVNDIAERKGDKGKFTNGIFETTLELNRKLVVVGLFVDYYLSGFLFQIFVLRDCYTILNDVEDSTIYNINDLNADITTFHNKYWVSMVFVQCLVYNGDRNNELWCIIPF